MMQFILATLSKVPFVCSTNWKKDKKTVENILTIYIIKGKFLYINVKQPKWSKKERKILW